MKFFTITYCDGDVDSVKVKTVKAKSPLEAWSTLNDKLEPGESWLLSIFEGKLKDLSSAID